jgi:hypothetical protein
MMAQMMGALKVMGKLAYILNSSRWRRDEMHSSYSFEVDILMFIKILRTIKERRHVHHTYSP